MWHNLSAMSDEYEFEEEGPALGEEDEGESELVILPDEENAGDGGYASPPRSVMGSEKGSVRSMRSGVQEKKERRYQNPYCKPVFQSGTLTIGMSQAKLYGLLDENGKLKLPEPVELQVDELTAKLARLGAMSEPRELDLSHIVDPEAHEETFKPSKSKQAESAMRNPRCGYDFIDRLNNQEGGFLARLQGNDKVR